MLQAILSFLSGIITKIMGDVINDALSKPAETERVETAAPDPEGDTDIIPPISDYGDRYGLHIRTQEGEGSGNGKSGSDS